MPLILLLTCGEQSAWRHAAHWDGPDLAQLRHALVGIVLLDHLGVVVRMLDLNVLVQTTLGAVALGAVLYRTLVVASALGGRSPMSFLLLVVDLEGHAQHLFVFAFI